MFFAVAVLAAVAYALQNTLMTTFYRRIDVLSAAAWRCLSLLISMAPLLLFVPAADLQRLPGALPAILLASVCAAIGNWAAGCAYRHLPVGLASALSMSAAAVVVALLGFTVLGERLRLEQAGLMAGILVGLVLLGRARPTGELPEHYHVCRGGFYCGLFGVFLGSAFLIIGNASRAMHPFLVGYVWEVSIGVILAGAALGRGLAGGASLTRLSRRDALRLFLYSSPTAIGTGCYALAMSMGPVAIAAALISTMMVFATLMATVVFKEQLTGRQWGSMLWVCVCVGLLKLAV